MQLQIKTSLVPVIGELAQIGTLLAERVLSAEVLPLVMVRGVVGLPFGPGVENAVEGIL